MLKCTQNEINRLQSNLQTIRQAGGWSTASFGDLLGVSKQTVCNLENGTSKMNKLQYIGIRSILDYEIEQRPKDSVLAYTVHNLLDSETLTEADKEKTQQAVAYASGAKMNGLDTAMITAGVIALVGSAFLEWVSTQTTKQPASKWLTQLMKDISI